MFNQLLNKEVGEYKLNNIYKEANCSALFQATNINNGKVVGVKIFKIENSDNLSRFETHVKKSQILIIQVLLTY